METKKSDRVNLEKKRSMFFQMGFLLALGFAFVAFEWQVSTRISDIVWESPPPLPQELEISRTYMETPPPPPPPQPSSELEIVDDTEYLGNLPDIHINVEFGQNLLSTDGLKSISIAEEPEPEIYDSGLLEEEALFNGKPAQDAFREYIGRNLVYPQMAIETHIFGKVFVQFVVDQKGNAVDVRVIRGVDPLLDNEAVRLIKSTSGMWTPGKQRNQPVKVRYTFPIHFRLQ